MNRILQSWHEVMNENDWVIYNMAPGTRFRRVLPPEQDGLIFVRTENGWENAVWCPERKKLSDSLNWCEVEILDPPMELDVLDAQIEAYLDDVFSWN